MYCLPVLLFLNLRLFNAKTYRNLHFINANSADYFKKFNPNHTQ
ncbi:hypothetical protein BN938_1786 [Mucinivorans hirudinis]|uniref:Uncharacterized protein n=1 Tax=Mucinivorans hirudinis TaxID=1433126 RepID=A0A060R8L4_9BACT|nr:hypothetical protein BN938_1786 [Mucinivorans hirudinis]